MPTVEDAIALYSSGQHKQAYELAVRELPVLLHAAAAAAQAQGRRDEAEKYRQLALAVQPDGVGGQPGPASGQAARELPALLNVAAAAAYAQGWLDEAEKYWRLALAVKPDHADAHNNLGLLLADQERFDQAEAAYRQALAANPRHADVCNNLGILLDRQNRHEEALAAFRKALAIQPNHAEALNHLGGLLYRQGQFKEAETAYRRALATNPRHADASNNLGVLLSQQNRRDEALAAYREALAIRPNFAEAYCNLGNLLQDAGHLGEAETAYRQALAIQPDYVEAGYNLGNLLAAWNHPEEAEAAYRQALAIRPDYAEAYCNLGLVLAKLKRQREAEEAYRQALALRPEFTDAQINLGNLLAAQDRHEEAEAAYRQALAMQPGSAEAHGNLGFFLAAMNRHEEAEAAYRQALALRPGCVNTSFNYALLLLSQGRFSEGWRLHETRYHPEQKSGPVSMPTLPFPQWQGEPLAGKSVLVWPEQGYGDAIQFCRLLPALKARGAAKVGLACRPALAALLETLDGVDAVHPLEDGQTLPDYDCWTFLLSLPFQAGLEVDSIPAALPYLSAPPGKIEQWQARLPATRPRVGLVWKGHAGHGNDARRSLPSLATLAPLWTVPGVDFVSLQKDAGEEEGRRPPRRQALTHLGSAVNDFADTAAIIAQLDLVICVDTAVAHLCGALGKPCWVLLPHRQTDWRWLRGREDSPWYPEVMRLFRQGESESWAEVAGRVAEALKAWRQETGTPDDSQPKGRGTWFSGLRRVFGK